MDSPKGKTLIPAFFSSVITFIAYLPSLKNGFVNWDDPDYVSENPLIRLADAGTLKAIFTTAVAGNWHPLTVLSLALDYGIWGLDPNGYHLANAILHSVNAALVYLLARALMEGRAAEARARVSAFVTAALFGLHPMHVESVAWVAERKDVLYAFFFLLSILSYLRYARSGSYYGYASSIALFVLALMSKPMAVTLPAVLLILDFYPLERLRGRKVFIEKIPFFLLSAVSSYITILYQKAGGAVVPYEAYPFYLRAVIAVRAVFFYLCKLTLPLDLAPFYPIPTRTGLFDHFFFLSAAFVIIMTLFCALTFKRQRLMTSAWAFYLATLSPVIGIIQVGSQAAADRYTYIPGVGPFLLSGLLLSLIHEKAGGMTLRSVISIFIAGILTALSVATLLQQGVWRDSVTLWTREIGLYPKVALAYNNRGLAYNDLGKFKEAIEDFDSAVSLKPGYAEAYNNRGISHEKTKDFERAIEDYKSAIGINPRLAPAYYNLGLAYSAIGEDALAFEMLQKSRSLGYRPGTP